MMLLRPQGLFGVKEIWDLFGKNKSKKRVALAACLPVGVALQPGQVMVALLDAEE